ncbi:hypothetical protein KIPB_012428, partial [Kipferlia bialata]|eukprot:g12428.t1
MLFILFVDSLLPRLLLIARGICIALLLVSFGIMIASTRQMRKRTPGFSGVYAVGSMSAVILMYIIIAAANAIYNGKILTYDPVELFEDLKILCGVTLRVTSVAYNNTY